MRALLLSLLLTLLSSTVSAQSSGYVPSTSPVLSGVYTVATLPSPADNQGRYAFVTDLGGGADVVLSDGAYWKHIRQGALVDVPAATKILLTPLLSPQMIRLTGATVRSSVSVVISQDGLYPGETFHVMFPGALSLGATIGVSVQGSAASPLGLLAGAWEDVQWNGTTLVKIAGGSL